MLILHSSSRCDVCLSEFSWEDTRKRPHAIACGHIFCRDCLYANSPPLCPLCRRVYQPAKIKRLHVDRPEATDENKELDLLQRLALAWESPPDQLKDMIEEVDTWLRNRSEDSCLPLRKARAALRKNSELREYGDFLRDYVDKLEQRRQSLEIGLQREQQKGLVQAEANRTMIDGLNKEVHRLTLQLEGMSSYSHRHTSRNPLPRPPEPISTDRVPTFEQAMEQAILESGLGARSVNLPTSPHRQPFEVENYGYRKGKSRSKDPWLEERSSYQTTSPSQQEASIPPIPSSSSYYVHPHTSSHPPRYEPVYSTATSTRATTLPTYAENTAQDFDIFNAMSFYMREYTSGFLNGQEVARGKRMTEGDNWHNSAPRASSSQAAHSSSRRHTEHRHPEQRPASAHHEPNGTYRHSTATNAHQNSPPPPHSAPVAGERSPRSSRRPETTSSIISSPVLSSRNDRLSSTSQTRSGGGMASIPTYHAQTPTPVNPSGASGHSVAPSENSVRSPSPRGSVVPTSPLPLPSQPQRIVPAPQPNVNVPVQAPTPYRPPSLISHQTQPSIDTWGTAPPSHLASGSLVSGLLALREGAEPAMMDAQESFVFRELNSHGSSIRSRNSIIGGVVDAVLEVPNPEYSPSRPVQSMVGVLPDEEEPASVYSPRAESDRPPSYRSSQSNGERYSPNHDQHQHQHQPVSPGHNRSRHSGGSSGSVVYDERSYRSSSSSRMHSSHEDRRQSSTQMRQDDQHSLASSQSSLRAPPAAGRLQHLSLPEESPLVEYTDDDQQSTGWHRRSASRSDSIEHSTESYNNALGLDF